MKITSLLVLLVIATAALTACGESGKGPEKPAGNASTQLSK
jgi:hypothetical protein